MPYPRILLTGATGYVGGRLLKALETDGHYSIRCLARRPENLAGKVADTTEVVPGDLLDVDSLNRAMAGVDVAYYLVHSLGSSGDFEAEEAGRRAELCRRRPRRRGFAHHLPGRSRQPADARTSPHLRSRWRVGDILRDSGATVIEFRASIVIGSGSVSFEMVRALVERLPVMITPRWVSVPAQPIAITDLLDYLQAALDVPVDSSRIFEVGGADVVSYGGLMQEYARQRGLRRRMIAVPVLTPRLSSLWLGLVTPVYARIGRKLIDSLRHASVVENPAPPSAFDIRPMGIANAIATAIRNEDRDYAATRWSDALSSSGRERVRGAVRFGTRLVDTRTVTVASPPDLAFEPVRRIGGGLVLRQRALEVAGLPGPAGRRCRRPPGPAPSRRPGRRRRRGLVACGKLLRRVKFYAEMRLPGRAWLEFEVTPAPNGGSVIRQTAEFDPIGLAGLMYWYALWPAHACVFRGMIRGIGPPPWQTTAGNAWPTLPRD